MFNVIIKISGRDALPLRAIPWVTAWEESPDSLVHAFIQAGMLLPKTMEIGGVDRQLARLRISAVARNSLVAYHCDPAGGYMEIPVNQWSPVMKTLDCLTQKLQADERAGAKGENHADWRIQATLELPQNAFVWLDQFLPWYARTRPLYVPTSEEEKMWRQEQAQQYAGEDLELILADGMDEFEQHEPALCFTPLVPAALQGKLWNGQLPREEVEKNDPFSEQAGSESRLFPTSRRGRPSTVIPAAVVLRRIIDAFADICNADFDRKRLPGTVRDLQDACRRIEKHFTKSQKFFSRSEDAFKKLLPTAGYSFGSGRRPSDSVQAKYWTQTAPHIMMKMSTKDFHVD